VGATHAPPQALTGVAAEYAGRTKPGPRPDLPGNFYSDYTLRLPHDEYEEKIEKVWADVFNPHGNRLDSREHRTRKDYEHGLIDEAEYLRQREENHAIYENLLTNEDRAAKRAREKKFKYETEKPPSREEHEAQLLLEHQERPYSPAALYFLRQQRQERELSYLLAHGLPTYDNLREARQNHQLYQAQRAAQEIAGIEYPHPGNPINQKISHVKLASAHYVAAQKVFSRYGLLHLL
jgi:hypothetical protein